MKTTPKNKDKLTILQDNYNNLLDTLTTFDNVKVVVTNPQTGLARPMVTLPGENRFRAIQRFMKAGFTITIN